MTTPSRPRAARKAPAKKASKPREERIETFEYLRARGRRSSLSPKAAEDIEPYLLGSDKGFDPPIAVGLPEGLVALAALDQAWRSGDAFGILKLLLGSEYHRVLKAFDTQPDSMILLVGLAADITTRFMGKGAADVPGGTPASSPK